MTDFLLQQQSSFLWSRDHIACKTYNVYYLALGRNPCFRPFTGTVIISLFGFKSIILLLIYSTYYLSASLFCCFPLHWQFFQYMHVLFLTQGYHVAQCLTIQFYCHKWVISCISSMCIRLPWSLLCILKFSNILPITFALLFIKYCAYRRELTTVYFLSPILVFFATALTYFTSSWILHPRIYFYYFYFKQLIFLEFS